MLKNYKLLLLTLLLLMPQLCPAAPNKADSLLAVLKVRMDNGLEDTVTVDLFILVAEDFITRDQGKAFEYTRKAMEIVGRLNNKPKAANISNNLGRIYRNRGIYDLSMEAFLKAFRIHEALNDKAGMSFCDNDIGNIYFEQGANDIALTYYRRALEYGRQSGQLHPQIVSLNNASLVYRQKNQFDSSRYLVRQALALSKKMGAPRQIILDYLYLGTINRKKGETANALACYDSALALTETLPDMIDMERAKINMMKGQVLMDAGKFSEALKLLAVAEVLYRKSEHQDIIILYRVTGQAWAGLKNYKKAEEYALKTLERAQKDELLPQILDAHNLLRSIYEAMGNPAKALASAKEAYRIHEIIFSDASSKKIASLQAAYQIHQKERELEQARQANLLQKHALRSQQARNTALLVISIMGLALAGAIAVAYRLTRRRSKQLLVKNRIIVQQKEEIARNLTELDEARKLAEAHSRAKSEFLSNMSHEIRTPMNAIIGFTDLMMEGSHDDETRQYLHSVQYAASNLGVIINDILDMSKIEAGELRVESIPFRPHTIVEELILLCKAAWSRKPVALNYTIEKDVPAALQGDPTRLHQVLLNLVNNAMKFTECGEVRLRVSVLSKNEGETVVRFEVSDTGIGIAAEKLPEIFENFKQGGSDTTRKFGGTGLGLAISKKLVEMQKGSIQAESNPGKGSLFTVDIPFVIDAEAPALAPTAAPAYNDQTEQPLPSGYHVLCVEDNHLNQLLIRRIFGKWDLKLSIASNGHEALEKYETEEIDLVLMDIQMPEMDGYETTRRIRQIETESGEGQFVPIIGLTADVFRESHIKAMEAGMNSIVMKPFRQTELLTAIREALSNEFMFNEQIV